MKQKTIIIISSFTILFFLLWSLGNYNWNNRYEKLDQDWCGVSNLQSEFSNDLLDLLEEYDEVYSEVDRFDGIDCLWDGRR